MRTNLWKIITVVTILAAGVTSPVLSRVEVSLSSAVDTTDADKMTVYGLWASYLNSRPDEIWKDPVWNGDKSRFWRDFDLTAPFVYPYNADSLLNTYTPIVLAIEADGSRYSIQTLFYADGLTPPNGNRNPLAIVRVFAENEGGRWRLRNALGAITEHWNRPAIGRITFVSPPSHHFDVALARRSVEFCDSLSRAFDFFKWDPFQYYVAESREDAARLFGLEYYFAGFPQGRALRQYDLLISGTGSEWFPRGLAQMVAAGPGLDPHPVVVEGFSGWVGGWNGKSYAQNMRALAATLAERGAVSFQDYVERDRFVNATEYFYGAVLCDLVFGERGSDGIEALFSAGHSDDDLYRAIESTLGFTRSSFESAWREKILEYR